MAESQTRIADLADEVCLSRHEPDDLLFAKAQLTKADLNFRRRAKSFDSHYYARGHPVQGTGLA